MTVMRWVERSEKENSVTKSGERNSVALSGEKYDLSPRLTTFSN